MRDDQVRRYARHILVPDIGGLGQTALMVATARLEVHDDAELIAAMFLAAGGVGKLAVGASAPELEQLAGHGPDTTLIALDGDTPAVDVVVPPKPAWWPSAPGDDLALAYWRGSIAATRWMATVANG